MKIMPHHDLVQSLYEHSDDSNKTQKGVNTVKFEINVFMFTNFIDPSKKP